MNSEAAAVIRVMLWVVLAGLAVLALVYLRSRHRSWLNTIAWGLVAVCVPLLGPFLVIATRAGERPLLGRANFIE